MSAGLFGKQILVLETEPFVNLDLVSALEQIGATALVAPTTGRAREILKLRRVAAAVIDLASPEARPFCAELKTKGIPFVVHTGGAFVDVGAADTVAKPAPASAVAGAVAAVLQRLQPAPLRAPVQRPRGSGAVMSGKP